MIKIFLIFVVKNEFKRRFKKYVPREKGGRGPSEPLLNLLLFSTSFIGDLLSCANTQLKLFVSVARLEGVRIFGYNRLLIFYLFLFSLLQTVSSKYPLAFRCCRSTPWLVALFSCIWNLFSNPLQVVQLC